MIVIQVLLITGVVTVMFLFLRSYSNRTRALTKIGAVLFAAMTISTIIYPNITMAAARLVGVGRGTDLVLYLLVLVVGFMAVNDNLHRRREQQRLARIVRQLALMEAPDPSTITLNETEN
ncbi:MAG: DUF2304 domain-containing protein [Propionibacteriaceae bacterium]|jgi:hypothetical protein|nr:DUF2304 domain-containing protein [Propionibacteriaceae bacterium]